MLLLRICRDNGHGVDIAEGQLIISTMIQMFEIWANDDASEFAAKLSGNDKFIIRTSLDSTYPRLLYAAPFVESNVNGLAGIIDAILNEMSKPRARID